MDLLVLKFLHGFASNKLNQTRCIDPFIWSRILDYTTKQIKLIEVKKWNMIKHLNWLNGILKLIHH